MSVHDAEPTADVDHLVLVGLLTVFTARIEYYTAALTSMLIAPSKSTVGDVVVDRMRFAQLATLAQRIVREQLNADSPAAELAEPIAAVIVDAQRVMNWRNQLLHAMWMLYPDDRTAMVLRRSGDTEYIPLTKLRGYVDDAEEVADRCSDLWFDLVHRYGHFDELIAATREMAGEEWWAANSADAGPSTDPVD